MSGFVRTADTVSATFVAEEVALLTDLLSQFASVIGERGARGTDAAVDRLLPDAYRDNAEYSDEFRRFTEDDLAAGKLHNAASVAQALAAPPLRRGTPVVLDDAAVQSWLRTLTDLRLTLAARAGIVSDEPPVPKDEREDMLIAIYDWLGYLQQSLIEAIDI